MVRNVRQSVCKKRKRLGVNFAFAIQDKRMKVFVNIPYTCMFIPFLCCPSYGCFHPCSKFDLEKQNVKLKNKNDSVHKQCNKNSTQI